MNIKNLTLACLAALSPAVLSAATVSESDPQAGGVTYKYTVTMGGLDSATFSSHVGAWSWEDDSLFNAANDEPPVGWTHTSNWVALNVSTTAVFTIRLERDANVPWPSVDQPDRKASVNSMFPSFTLWKNWDNDDGDSHTYNNRGAVSWAEDLVYQDHYDNSTEGAIERTYVLTPGQYTVAIGSNAPATDTDRQGYKAIFTTSQDLPIVITADSYFTQSAIAPVTVSVAKGVLANDSGVSASKDTVELVTQPARGSVALNADGSFTYTPGAYFGVVGRDSFSYRVNVNGDPGTQTQEASATISTLQAAEGCYAGHLKNEDSQAVAGVIKMDVTRSGKWTAAVVYGGKKYSLRGSIGVDGEMLPKKASALDIGLHLSTHADGDRHAHVHIHGGAEHYGAKVMKSPFSTQNPPPSTGNHTVALAVDASSQDAPTTPGKARLKISRSGSAVLVGKLGDKAAFSSASALIEGSGPGPVLPVYSIVYRAPAGSVSGQLEFGAAATSTASGLLQVVKPTQTKPASLGYTISYKASTVAK